MTLKELQIGKSAIVDAVGGAGALRQHFLDMGLIPGAEVTLVKLAPMGDPMELRIHGYELTLRLDDAAQITVTPTEKTPAVHAPVAEKMVEHPGLGEGGKYHTKEGEHPLPEDKTLTFALAGNQNCGKTTLFNQLTGSNQHVGNFPGVTVDRKSGAIKGHPETEVTDLPGIYSMSPYSSEEIVTRQFIIGEKPTGIINIVDATNIERNLYLTMQLMELDIPMVLALNMMDEMRGNGGTVRINKMEAMLGIPVIPISAAKNEGVDELVDHAVHVAKYQERPGRMDFCSEDDHGGAVHRCIHGILHLIEDHAKAAGIPVRFAATKLVEGDQRIEEALKLDQNEKEMIEHIIVQMEQERGLDRAAAIADMRFSFIQELVAQTVVKPHESKEQLRSNRIDKFLTGKYTAIPAFIAIMGLVFFLTFNVIGLFFQNLMEMGIDALTGIVDTALTNWNVNAAVHSLVIDGIFTGVGSVLSFLPIIVVLFFFLSMLEDTGYMARVAFVMDKLLRRIGLSGRSIVPMLIGFGCTVPGVMASRTLPSERDRKMTILLTPFMSCSAKLPIYSLFAAAFFPKYAGLVMVLLYFTGIYIAVHLEAKKLGLKGIPREQLPRVRQLLPKIYLLAPLVLLVVMVSTNMYTMAFSAAIAIVAAVAVGLVNNVVEIASKSSNREDFLTFGKIIDALEGGAKGSITVAVACGVAGIISGCITVTGLASKLLSTIVSLSGGHMIIALALTMLCCIVLGMGVPTTANYCIMAATCAPILMDPSIGVTKMAAHFFVFYFGIVADITPPVALAAYAGSAIAKSDPMKTGINATKLAIAAFIVPYIFAMNPSMLLMDQGVLAAIQVIITSCLGIFGIAAALEGYIVTRAPWWQRILLAAGGLCLIDPEFMTDVVGVAVIVVVIVLQIVLRKHSKPAAA